MERMIEIIIDTDLTQALVLVAELKESGMVVNKDFEFEWVPTTEWSLTEQQILRHVKFRFANDHDAMLFKLQHGEKI